MKTFFIAIAIFALLLGVIVWNSFFINRTMDTMEAALEALPACESAAGALEDLETYWEKRHALIACSISFDEINQMDTCLAQMRAATQQKDALQFETGRLLAQRAVEDMRRLERFAFDCIL